MRRAIKNGYVSSPQLLDVTTYLRLAVYQARSFHRWASTRGMAWEDLIGEAHLALVNAAARFDPGQGVSFACYAATAIRNRLIRAIRRHHRYLSMATADGEVITPPDRPRPDPDAILDVQTLLGQLTPYERDLIVNRFGLVDGKAQATQRLANQRPARGERARLILERALMKLRCRQGLLAGVSLQRCARENPSCRLQVEESEF
jgi:RNA polymerase sigma factor (sigma-70 family)